MYGTRRYFKHAREAGHQFVNKVDSALTSKANERTKRSIDRFAGRVHKSIDSHLSLEKSILKRDRNYSTMPTLKRRQYTGASYGRAHKRMRFAGRSRMKRRRAPVRRYRRKYRRMKRRRRLYISPAMKALETKRFFFSHGVDPSASKTETITNVNMMNNNPNPSSNTEYLQTYKGEGMFHLGIRFLMWFRSQEANTDVRWTVRIFRLTPTASRTEDKLHYNVMTDDHQNVSQLRFIDRHRKYNLVRKTQTGYTQVFFRTFVTAELDGSNAAPEEHHINWYMPIMRNNRKQRSDENFWNEEYQVRVWCEDNRNGTPVGTIGNHKIEYCHFFKD